MAPEQVTHYRDVKPAADQYSAAATLYKLLTGHYTHDLPKDLGAQIAHLVTADAGADRRTPGRHPGGAGGGDPQGAEPRAGRTATRT